jgi:hypothetical protein
VNDGLTQGFQAGFLVLSLIALLGAAITAVMLAPQPDRAEVERVYNNRTPLEEAA